ncbi:MAG TPA: MFS transporter, partial [Pyrinomonadaceae bacterium]|nr:MFS transporter [Pyrinomonadaceae bacterium]
AAPSRRTPRRRPTTSKTILFRRDTRRFFLIWLGETGSSIGTGLTNFTLSIWVYQKTGSASVFALVSFVATVPSVVLLPVIGALVDRWHLRRTMIWSNVAASLSTLGITLLVVFYQLEVAYVFVVLFLRAICLAFIEPAYLTSSTLLVPKEDLTRAAGMTQSSQAARQVVSPLLAGLLIQWISIPIITLLDFLSYAFAVITVLTVPAAALEVRRVAKAERSLRREIVEGWSYIRQRPGLLSLLVYFASINFFIGVEVVLLTPLVLSFSTTTAVGVALSAAGAGFLAGSLVTAVWGGPKNHVNGIAGFGFLFTFSGMAIALRPSLLLVAGAAFLMNFALPFMNVSTQAIWQKKTAVSIQGRVFAVRRLAVVSVMPLSFLTAGPLSEKYLEPLANSAGPLQPYLELLTGTGRGRGFALMFIVAGLLTLVVQLVMCLYPRFRNVEAELPDAIPDKVSLAS